MEIEAWHWLVRDFRLNVLQLRVMYASTDFWADSNLPVNIWNGTIRVETQHLDLTISHDFAHASYQRPEKPRYLF